MLKSFKANDVGESLLENYGRQVVRSQLRHRADTAINDRYINSKNIIELKSYFVTSLISRLSPKIENVISWAGQIDTVQVDATRHNEPHADPGEIVASMQSILTLLTKIDEFAQLEAGISDVLPQRLQMNHLVAEVVSASNAKLDNVAPIFEFGTSEYEFLVLGDAAKITDAIELIFKYVSSDLSDGDKVSVWLEEYSNVEMALVAKYPGHEVSDVVVKRLLNSRNLVDQMIGHGPDNIKLAMPTAQALIEIHNGRIVIENAVGGGMEIRVILPRRGNVETVSKTG